MTVVRRTAVQMSTLVTIEVVGDADAHADSEEGLARIDRAFGWFADVEAVCTRFDSASELMQLSATCGVAVPVSAMLFEAVQFAVAVAEASSGAFDPTVGRRMERAGFTRHHRTGVRVDSPVPAGADVDFHAIELDPEHRTIRLTRPLVLDLGGVAKGLAIDMAARELSPFRHFAVDAGGDLYLSGQNAEGRPWSVGIRHPRADGQVIESLRVSDRALCTSGDYERRGPDDTGHHILDPRSGTPTRNVASVTVMAPTAMVADALATTAFVLAERNGDEALRWLESQGVDGLLYSSSLERSTTAGFAA